MIIRINDKNGKNIAECDLQHHDMGVWYTNHKSNILNIDIDIIQTETGFDDILDIDIDNLIYPKKIGCIKSLVGAWTEFEVLRTEYNLDTASDYGYIIDILHKPLLHGLITEDEYISYVDKIKEFLGYEEEGYNTYFTNNEYTYSEIDELICSLNSIYDI